MFGRVDGGIFAAVYAVHMTRDVESLGELV